MDRDSSALSYGSQKPAMCHLMMAVPLGDDDPDASIAYHASSRRLTVYVLAHLPYVGVITTVVVR
jgi:hypothetical protein